MKSKPYYFFEINCAILNLKSVKKYKNYLMTKF